MESSAQRRQPIAGVGHLSGCPLFHPSELRSRVKRKAERPRPLLLSDSSRVSSDPSETPFRKSRSSICRNFNLGLAGRLVRSSDVFACVGHIARCVERHVKLNGPQSFRRGLLRGDESMIATSAFPTMDSCDASVFTPSRKSSIDVLSPRVFRP